MRENAWSTLLVTIHRRPENLHVGMPFVHNWLRKRTYTLSRNCRGTIDLQLFYSPLGPLMFQNRKKNCAQQCYIDLFHSQNA
jgi:hypothetical protein